MATDHFNPIVSGIINGIGLGDQIRRAALERERLKLEQAQEMRIQQQADQAANLNDIAIHEKMLNLGARPLDQTGTVSQPVTVGPTADNPSGDPNDPMFGVARQGIPLDTQIARKADSSRTVKYKTRDGKQLSYELPTIEEQLKNTLSQKEAFGAAEMRQRADTAGAEENARLGARTADRAARLKTEGIDIPDINDPNGRTIRALPAEVDDLMRAQAAIYNAKNKPEKAAKATVPAPKWMAEALGIPPETEIPIANLHELVKSANEKLHPSGGLTPYQQYEVGRNAKTDAEKQAEKAQKAQESRVKPIQDQIDKIQTEKDKIASRNEQLGEQLRLGTKKKDAGKIQAEIVGNNARFQALHQQQLNAQKLKDGIYGGRQQTSVPAQQAAPAGGVTATNPQTGEKVTFDGKAWVPLTQ